MPNETYIHSDFRAHLELLKPDGFTLNSDDIFEKSINNGTIFISVGGDEHFPHGVGFRQVMVGIRFTNVESLFKQACLATNNGVYRADEDDSTFGRGFADDVIGEAGWDALWENEVVDDHSFQIIRPLQEQMINAALEWVAKYDTLEKAYAEAELLSLDERSSIYTQPFPAKYMIVKKLLNKSDYSSYTTTAIANASNRGRTERVAFLTALKNILDAL